MCLPTSALWVPRSALLGLLKPPCEHLSPWMSRAARLARDLVRLEVGVIVETLKQGRIVERVRH